VGFFVFATQLISTSNFTTILFGSVIVIKLLLSTLTLYFIVSGYAHASETPDANENGEITEQEFLNFKAKKFNSVDKNFDAKITQAEIQQSYIDQMQEIMRQAFRSLDDNKDGRLDPEDFHEEYGATEMDDLLQSQEEAFDRMDKNRNDSISRLEYNEFLQSQLQESEKVMRQYSQENFDRLDLDNNGFVDEDEYVFQGRDQNYNQIDTNNPFSKDGDAVANLEKPVQRDANGDGDISKSEDIAFNEYSFSIMDKNSDGVISKKENALLFVDSDFSSYGFVDTAYIGSEVQRLPRNP
jgi:Ca2+-binding EF-hand superfamily protein